MSNLNVFNQSWNEIVFEGRNKEYGAYKLRQENPRTTLKALFYGSLVCASLISIPIISSLLKNPDTPVAENPVLLPGPIIYVERITPIEELPKKASEATEKSSAEQKKHVTPTITDNTTTPTEVETIDPNKTIKTGSDDNPGDNQGAIAIGNGTIDGEGDKPNHSPVIPKTNGGGDDIIDRSRVQASPEFPGGIKSFLALVGKRFKTPDIGEEGIQRIFVYFVVEKDGTLSNIKVLKDPGYGLGNEAIRVLKSIKTKWKPGIQNNEPVRTAYNLPISVDMKNN